MTSIDPAGPAAASPADLPHDVLVVEDDPLIAFDASETIRDFGVAAVRTAGSVAAALELIEQRPPHFVLLDVGLGRDNSFVVAEQLDRLKIPFVFVTGYSGGVRAPSQFANYPVLTKPYMRAALLAALHAGKTKPPERESA